MSASVIPRYGTPDAKELRRIKDRIDAGVPMRKIMQMHRLSRERITELLGKRKP